MIEKKLKLKLTAVVFISVILFSGYSLYTNSKSYLNVFFFTKSD